MKQLTLLMVFSQIVLSQDPVDPEDPSISRKRMTDFDSLEGLKLISETKLIPRRYVLSLVVDLVLELRVSPVMVPRKRDI